MSSSRQNLRTLLPRPADPVTSAVLGTSRRRAATVPPMRRRRCLSLSACETCRRRKSKCNARRPICSACESHGWECVYMTEPTESRIAAVKRRYAEIGEQNQELRESHDAFSQLFEALKTLDDATADTVLQQIRQGAEVTLLVQNIRAGNLLMELHETLGPTTPMQRVVGAAAKPILEALATVVDQGDEVRPAMDVAQAIPHVQQSPYEELFNLLKHTGESEALFVIQNIRQGHSVEDTLYMAKETNPLRLPSPVSTT